MKPNLQLPPSSILDWGTLPRDSINDVLSMSLLKVGTIAENFAISENRHNRVSI